MTFERNPAAQQVGDHNTLCVTIAVPLDVDLHRINIRRAAMVRAARCACHVRFTPHLDRRMMMAHDSGHTPSRMDGEIIDAVREALREYLGTGSSSALQHALVRLATEAREKSILPEQLLIMLKDTWNALPEVRAMTDTPQQIRLLQRVVTMCIKEYYSA